ncbi:hypothetical protein [Mitsuokella jalaludinii]|uniref:hypothetical protein n=1 Tax=Mitsuokella jalaludinii TaxID=187979 RepID=UPI003F968674
MKNETKKWTCICGAVNTTDFCESCGTPREKVVNPGKTEDQKEKSEISQEQKSKLSDNLKPDPSSEQATDCYARIARKEEQEKTSVQTDHIVKEGDNVPIFSQDTWDCSCGKKGNIGRFCSNCGHAKPGTNTSSLEPVTEETISLTPVSATPPVQPVSPVSSPDDVLESNRQSESFFNRNKKILLGTTVIFLCLLGYVFYHAEKHEPVVPSTSSVVADAKKDNNGKYVREMKTDLSLGGLDLGISTDEMHKALGKENYKKNSEDVKGMVFYEFENLEVGVIRDEVNALVSNGSSAKTKRGIHEGSSYQDMIDAYGSDYTKMNYDDKILYEYTFKSLNGKDGLLRFAINKKNDKIAYISVRIPVESAEKNKPDKSIDIKGAQTVFLNYHKAISQKHFDDAYDMLTSDCQNQMGDLSTYASGYKDTLNSSVDSLKIVSSFPDQVTMKYRLIARDRYKGNRVKVQIFNGAVTVIKKGNIWKIDKMKSSKVDEKIEN